MRHEGRPRDAYRALGFDTFDDLLAGRRLGSRVQAMKLITLVETYPQKLALKLGVEKGYALVRYTAATPAADASSRETRRSPKRLSLPA